MRGTSTSAAFGVLLSGLVLSGCAADVKFGTADPAAEPIRAPNTGSESVPATQWPDTCTFLTDEEMTALLPAHKGIERTPREVRVFDLTVDLNGQHEDMGGTAQRGSCAFQADHGGDTWVSIVISLDWVGDPGVVRRHYAQDRSSALDRRSEYTTIADVDNTDAEACYHVMTSGSTEVTCHQGRFEFSVRTSAWAEIPGGNDGQHDAVLAHQLQPEVVNTLAAKMS